jgi:hypothetical protein
MALFTPSSNVSMDAASAMYAPQISDGLVAGEALLACAPCYIKASDGKVYQSNGTSANEAAKFDGMTPRAVAIGQPVTLFGVGAKFEYSTGMTPGANLFIATTAGRLADTATTGDAVGVARAITATVIRVTRNVA